MKRIVVLGAGVVGQVYAGLLAQAGHDVALVARGRRLQELRSAGVVLRHEGMTHRPPCRIVESASAAEHAEVLLVAVRGDQLSGVIDAAPCPGADAVVCMANPLGSRDEFRRWAGAERTVFTFSGIGGRLEESGAVSFHRVRQQPTVVDAAAPRNADIAALIRSAGLKVRHERHMGAWLTTHSVFMAGIGSALLAAEDDSRSLACSPSGVRDPVVAVSEAFNVLARRGQRITPSSLRAIFGRVPLRFATSYWQRQCASPMVRLSIEPHIRATRGTEFPLLVAFARNTVGDAAPAYRALLDG